MINKIVGIFFILLGISLGWLLKVLDNAGGKNFALLFLACLIIGIGTNILKKNSTRVRKYRK